MDADDYWELSKYSWYAQKAENSYYACRTVHIAKGKKTRIVWMHREVISVPAGRVFYDSPMPIPLKILERGWTG